jgi:hypothetical protein
MLLDESEPLHTIPKLVLNNAKTFDDVLEE